VPTVAELSAPYGNFMLGPRPGPGVCEVCCDLTAGGTRCFGCAHNSGWLDAVAPISYSVAHEQLHHVLAGYKRGHGTVAERFRVELAAVLWRFLAEHETCVAQAAGTSSFEVVTTVPSSSALRDPGHPLPTIVGELVGATQGRYERLLRPGPGPAAPREFSLARYTATGPVGGRSILLLDDTWTTGASVHSAAATLKRAGAGVVAVVVIGRHLHREFADNDRRLRALPQPFDWSGCACESISSDTSPNLNHAGALTVD
jgi:hypothetical protein